MRQVGVGLGVLLVRSMARDIVIKNGESQLLGDDDVLHHKMGRCRCDVCVWQRPLSPRVNTASKQAAPAPVPETIPLLGLPDYREPRCGYLPPPRRAVEITEAVVLPPKPPPSWARLLVGGLAFLLIIVGLATLAPGPGPATWAVRRDGAFSQGAVGAVGADSCGAQVTQEPEVAYCDSPSADVAYEAAPADACGGAAGDYGLVGAHHSPQKRVATSSRWDRFDTWSVSQPQQ